MRPYSQYVQASVESEQRACERHELDRDAAIRTARSAVRGAGAAATSPPTYTAKASASSARKMPPSEPPSARPPSAGTSGAPSIQAQATHPATSSATAPAAGSASAAQGTWGSVGVGGGGSVAAERLVGGGAGGAVVGGGAGGARLRLGLRRRPDAGGASGTDSVGAAVVRLGLGRGGRRVVVVVVVVVAERARVLAALEVGPLRPVLRLGEVDRVELADRGAHEAAPDLRREGAARDRDAVHVRHRDLPARVADPDGRRELRRVAAEPRVGVVLGRARSCRPPAAP